MVVGDGFNHVGHTFVSVEEVAASSIEEISDKCFDLIEAPIRAAHPKLFKKL